MDADTLVKRSETCKFCWWFTGWLGRPAGMLRGRSLDAIRRRQLGQWLCASQFSWPLRSRLALHQVDERANKPAFV